MEYMVNVFMHYCVKYTYWLSIIKKCIFQKEMVHYVQISFLLTSIKNIRNHWNDWFSEVKNNWQPLMPPSWILYISTYIMQFGYDNCYRLFLPYHTHFSFFLNPEVTSVRKHYRLLNIPTTSTNRLVVSTYFTAIQLMSIFL